MQKLLGASWFQDIQPYAQAGLVILIAVCCMVMVIAILASPPQTGRGSNAITGASESYYTKNRGANNQGRIRNLIIICALVIAVSAVLYFISYSFFQGGFG